MATPPQELERPEPASTPRGPSAMHVAGWLAAGLVVIMLAALLFSRISAATSATQAATRPAGKASASLSGISLVGKVAPDVALQAWTGRTGQRVSLSSLRGHPVVLNFWEASCVPCAAEAPLLAQAQQTYGAQQVQFVGAALYTSQSDGQSFLTQHHLSYLAGGVTSNQPVVDYALIGVPDTYFINSNGVIVAQVVGQLSRQSLDAGIQKALR